MNSELILLLYTQIEMMENEINFSIEYTNKEILFSIRELILTEFQNIGITFLIEKDKTKIFLYKL